MEQILPLPKAAKAASVSLSTLKRLISSGAIRKVRISEGRVGVLESELDDYLLSHAESVE